MSTKSPIEWTEFTWNPLAGCELVSPGCTHCYAMKLAHRLAAMGQTKYIGTTHKVNGQAVWTGQINLDEAALLQPLSRKKPTVYFVNSMSDLFHQDVPDDYIDKVFAVMALSPQHIFQVLTKRPERMAEYFASTSFYRFWQRNRLYEEMPDANHNLVWRAPKPSIKQEWPLPNIWLGTSVENQAAYDARVEHLKRTPAAVRFLSAEPLLGAINMGLSTRHSALSTNLWLIAGGESGANARPMHPDWPRSLRDQCAAANVPFFFKQWGNWMPIDKPWDGETETIAPLKDNQRWMNQAGGHGFHGVNVWRVGNVGKHAAGRLLDGREHNDYPQAVMVSSRPTA